MHKTICKPFRETGYCGYGDTCKYSHERYVEEEAAAAVDVGCGICRKEMEEEVAAMCGHRFCSACALRRHQEVDECGVCRRLTYGRFWMQ